MGRRKTVQDIELLSAARGEFIEHGAAASTRAIARRAGISEAVIYQRYATKHELFFAAMIPPPAPDLLAMLARPGGPAGEMEQLQEIASFTLAYFRQLLPVLLPVLAQSEFSFEEFALRHPTSPLQQLRTQMRAFFEPVQASLAPGQPPDPRTAASAMAFIATLQGLAMFERLGAHGGHFGEVELREIVRALWHGAAR